jgi:hypothetical protein
MQRLIVPQSQALLSSEIILPPCILLAQALWDGEGCIHGSQWSVVH